MAEKKFLTPKEVFELAGGIFTPDLFVTTPGPCENPKLFIPTVTVPAYLMDEVKAKEVQAALDECISIVGAWGQKRSRITSPDFIKAAVKFQALTGLDPLDILDLVRHRSLSFRVRP